ncbi:HDIG domain-containing protein [Clostridium bowmanii]|uniref:HDIG domain-containing metalloprotein n=1 Tax=Clostridium bowmanii TaxID=132925 RepID=UPI001C0E5F41|nr:HDIG domain-containing metalloprotein [Clostridium bowmanii]MBU3189991.1 HDIG domain-containing protein [Clostridium bowmanii]MCA1074575.1 HDIG domain-containing protein [Clostridium bowmanii]
MEKASPNREQAFELLKKYNKSDSLIKHGLSVEAVMRHFAELNNEDVDKWGIVGLLHDVDYEMYPQEHCVKARDILEAEGYPEEYIHAVQSHGFGLCIDVEPIHKMENVLFTIDELTGLITATALMRPSKSVLDLEVKSVKKKFKQRSFAAGVNRDVILSGSERMGMEIGDILNETIKGMQSVAGEIGLKGEL